MARPWLDSDRGDQIFLFPVDSRDLLPKNHLVWGVMKVVDEFDLSQFEAVYHAGGVGRPPYSPRLMVALIVYCYLKGLRSERQIAAACYDDIGCRVITGNRYPDHSVVKKFFTRHEPALQRLLIDTLRIGHAEGLIDLSVIAGDGTYMQADAAMNATVTETRLLEQIADLQAQMARAQAGWADLVTAAEATEGLDAATDGLDPATDGGDLVAGCLDLGLGIAPVGGPVQGRPEDDLWLRYRALETKVASRRAALEHLQANPGAAWTEWSDRGEKDQTRVVAATQRWEAAVAAQQTVVEQYARAQAAGVRSPGRPPVPVADHSGVAAARQGLDKAVARAAATAGKEPTVGRVNTTAPSSGIMPCKRGGFDQNYNVQVAACEGQFILAIGTHPSSNDKRALEPFVRATRANLDAAGIADPIGVALYDCGYASDANFTAELPVGLLLVAVEKECRQTGRRTDDTTTAAKSWDLMATRLAEPANAALYKRRGAIVEPVFAQMFDRFGRDVNSRGATQVETELHVCAISHNIGKIIRSRVKKHV
jgi:transposase